MELLHKVSIHCESNSMDAQSLAVVMAPNILPCQYDGGRGREIKSIGIDVKNMTCKYGCIFSKMDTYILYRCSTGIN